MTETIAILISVAALSVSIISAWLTFFRQGKVKMTQPTVIFFGPDGGRRDGEALRLKVFLRTLLYSTSHRGQTVESMHVSLHRGESRQNFSIWIYGEEQLIRGSGLHISANGVASNHHFLLPEDGSTFNLLNGEYNLKVFAKRVSDSKPVELISIPLTISESHAQELTKQDVGIYFDWGPDQ